METKKKGGKKFSFDRFLKKKKKPKNVSLDNSNGEYKNGWNSNTGKAFSSSATDINQRSRFQPGPIISENRITNTSFPENGMQEMEYTTDEEGSLCLWADTMSKEQITECKIAFAHFDKNGDGKVCWKDFGKILRNLGQNPTETELEDIRIDRILQSGTNGTCSIDFPEFITIIAKRFGIDGVDEMEKAFRAFDENGDGLISFAEFKSYNQKIGQFLSDEEINEFIKEVDIDGDGFLNYEEFVRMNIR